MNSSEEPTQRAHLDPQLPTVPFSQGGPDATIPTVDDMATVTMSPASSLAHMAPTEQFSPAPHAAPTEHIVPEFAVAPTEQAALPSQVYNPSGSQVNATQSAMYPNMEQPAYAAPYYDPNAYTPLPGQAYPAQPGMPFPGQPGMPMPARKKRPIALLATLALVIVLLVGGGTAFAIMQANASTPTKTLQKYCDGFKTQNAQEIYDTYSAASKQATSLDEVRQGFGVLQGFTSLMKISSCTVSDVQQQDSTATGKVTINMSISFGEISTSVSLPLGMKLVLENNEWKIDVAGTTMPKFTMPNLPTFPPDFLTPTPVNQ